MTLDDAGSEAFSWYDVLVMVSGLQSDPSSALTRELHGPRWTVDDFEQLICSGGLELVDGALVPGSDAV